MRVKAIYIFLVGSLLFFTAGPYATPVFYPGVVSVDTVEAFPGDQFAVKVGLTGNDADIAGLTIPLKYPSPYLTIDSVSFLGTLKPTDVSGAAYIDAENHTVKISYVPGISADMPFFSEASGLIARIFFRLDNNALPTTIPIDSINVDSVIAGTVHYWQRIEFSDNTGEQFYLPDYIPGAVIVGQYTDVDEGLEAGLPSSFALNQNYPNPFNPATVIGFALPRAGHVRLEVFNVLGQKVATLVDRRMAAGAHQVEFDGAKMPSGIYFYRLNHAEGAETKKMILIK
ncbi:MAG: T9SS type A sorting domain-containing protein [candidate division Zixibacteria bacterium]|nr:T9SS type A sorting domain-containing protein [candidate division Zixibacteria bacterium]